MTPTPPPQSPTPQTPHRLNYRSTLLPTGAPPCATKSPYAENAATSTVLGLIGFMTCGVLGVVALVFAINALIKMNRHQDFRGLSLAVIGIILGTLNALLCLVFLTQFLFSFLNH